MKLAIKGHPERGEEVIKLLEMMGGVNIHRCTGIKPVIHYFNNEGIIENKFKSTDFFILTLEEFEALYPYKIGEKVLYHSGDNRWLEGIINKMLWNENNDSLYYYVNNIDGTNAGRATTMFLKPMKKKELKDYLKPGYVIEQNDGLKFVITQDVHGNNFGLQIGKSTLWSSLENLELINRVYQINEPGALHQTCIHDYMLTLVWEKPKEVELTMQQIADKFGIDVNELKIKK